ncbi:hypothetical protein GLAREA_02439 [Glarea lozoyensis ATCC 20868]|uniref:Uncharacterized protein n=1 Tax=Glarea lozoyensis (strain ATCC 20868 / MF5171) TaxID=1116229 RepID=S3D378_GLAL2|nr:uncharacterized protein GLAREA_02439 [Glarea lozoyensis ATCC 20868]EPE26526.1 hypothetical protein GLAREA_02439 [Glarea lozoyensis ATCC 20868]
MADSNRPDHPGPPNSPPPVNPPVDSLLENDIANQHSASQPSSQVPSAAPAQLPFVPFYHKYPPSHAPPQPFSSPDHQNNSSLSAQGSFAMTGYGDNSLYVPPGNGGMWVPGEYPAVNLTGDPRGDTRGMNASNAGQWNGPSAAVPSLDHNWNQQQQQSLVPQPPHHAPPYSYPIQQPIPHYPQTNNPYFGPPPPQQNTPYQPRPYSFQHVPQYAPNFYPPPHSYPIQQPNAHDPPTNNPPSHPPPQDTTANQSQNLSSQQPSQHAPPPLSQSVQQPSGLNPKALDFIPQSSQPTHSQTRMHPRVLPTSQADCRPCQIRSRSVNPPPDHSIPTWCGTCYNRLN